MVPSKTNSRLIKKSSKNVLETKKEKLNLRIYDVIKLLPFHKQTAN